MYFTITWLRESLVYNYYTYESKFSITVLWVYRCLKVKKRKLFTQILLLLLEVLFIIRGSLNKFPEFFVLALLLIVHTWNSSPLLSSLLRLQCTCTCREEENLVFCFGAQFNSTLNFTQSGWLILFSPDLYFRLAKRVSGQTHSLRLETATRTDVPLVVPA